MSVHNQRYGSKRSRNMPPVEFPHQMGRDCVTSAMRNMLAFYGLDMPEAVIFGLGCGLSFWYSDIPESPFPVLLGQNIALEYDLCAMLDIKLQVHAETPGSLNVRDVVIERACRGIPTIIKADPYYLDYCWRDMPPGTERTHFGEHILVVVYADDATAWISDIWSDELERVSLDALLAARTTEDGYAFLRPRGRWYEMQFPDEFLWRQKLLPALRMTAQRMLAAQGAFGIAGIRLAAQRMSNWVLSASMECVSTGSAIIAQRMDEGATGSCFRQLWVEFLEWVAEHLQLPRYAEIATTIQEDVVPLWRDLILLFRSLATEAANGTWRQQASLQVDTLLHAIALREEEIFQQCLKIR